MEITGKLEYFLDGGTIGIPTNEGKFYIDRRCPHSKNKTLNQLFENYPTHDGYNKKATDPDVIDSLIDALKRDLNNDDHGTGQLALDILRKEI